MQIFGSEPYYISKAVEHKALEKFDVIDINMGCPVPKIVKASLVDDIAVDKHGYAHRPLDFGNNLPIGFA